MVALGGDGTVNEIVNGLLTDGPHHELPALAVVPEAPPTSSPGHGPARPPVRGDRPDPGGAAGGPQPAGQPRARRRPLVHLQRRARLRRRRGAPDREAAQGRRAAVARAVRPGRDRPLLHGRPPPPGTDPGASGREADRPSAFRAGDQHRLLVLSRAAAGAAESGSIVRHGPRRFRPPKHGYRLPCATFDEPSWTRHRCAAGGC